MKWKFKQRKVNGVRLSVIVLTAVAFLLSGMPKARVVFGAPLYLVDGLILWLVLLTSNSRPLRFRGLSSQLYHWIWAFAFFMVLGELRGILVYGHIFDSVYLLMRFCLAISLVTLVPKTICSIYDLAFVVKGLCAGLSLSALLSILYSLPFTRFIARAVFSIKTICPVAESGIVDSAEALRGQTLIGTSTFSSGVMGLLWPIIYMGSALFRKLSVWRPWVMVALFIVPIGIVTTYGRSAWLSVALVFSSMMLWGGAGSRLKSLFVVLALGGILVQVGLNTQTARVDIVVSKTERTIQNPLGDENERHRFLAYVDPFRHLVRNPSFLLAGTGEARRKWGGKLYGGGSYASHTTLAQAYFSYGVGGAVSQVFLLVTLFRLCLQRMRHANRFMALYVWGWRALLGACFGGLPWWLFGHGIISQPRGAMVYYLFIGLVLAYDRIYVAEVLDKQKQ